MNFGRPELKALTALWQARRGTRIAPDRADFDPLSLRDYLSRIIIYDVVGDPPQHRFRFRLYGTLIAEHSGRDATGKLLDDVMPPEACEDYCRLLNGLMEKPQPLRVTGTLYYLDRSFVHFECVSLPLTVNGGDRIGQIMDVLYYPDEA
ncbi:PAS domain-containing protein [Ferrovibrio sp.]|uniref:PAS domain-containing protein n=1 Tax=Ferrovibrio sp. TaxID=1917215 RepID=UPI003516E1E9